jgi:uncharacterized protein with PQ loop repeat
MEQWMVIVGLSMAIPAIIQILKVIRLGKSNQIAISSYLLIIHGCGWWTYYGYHHSASVMITNAFGVMINIAAIVVFLKYRKK